MIPPTPHPLSEVAAKELTADELATLKRNWQAVMADVTAAANACGRDPTAITIIGVTKYVDEPLTAGLIQCGCCDLGENRPQLLSRKAEALTDGSSPTWHMIGHLQTNKVRRVLRYRPVIHSVDSQRLLDMIAQESERAKIQTECLLEVNISGDESKTGMTPEQIRDVLGASKSLSIQITGLMAMAGRGSDSETARQHFRQVRELRDELQDCFDHPLPQLSMGMSGDFGEAIKEGATMVRIGSRIFAGLLEKNS